MSENETTESPITDQSAADILNRLQAANPHLMEETLAGLTREQRDAATQAMHSRRSGR
jgi:hypothetical protein